MAQEINIGEQGTGDTIPSPDARWFVDSNDDLNLEITGTYLFNDNPVEGITSLELDTLLTTDAAADPSTNGEIQRNGSDLKVYSGGAVRNLSDVGQTAFDLLTINDTTSDPTSNGEFTRNGADVKVYSGGSVKNLSDVGSFDEIQTLVDHPDKTGALNLEDTESYDIGVPVDDQETLEVYRWGCWRYSDFTAPTGLQVQLLDGGDTVQASANTTDNSSTSSPVASYQNTSGSASLFKLRVNNGTGSDLTDGESDAAEAHYSYRVA